MKHTLTTLLFCTTLVHANTDSNVQVTGFVDTYYVHDFNTASGARQDFLFNHNRAGEFNTNLALLSLELAEPSHRGVIRFQAGTYAQDNYAAEDTTMQNIHEAYMGIALDGAKKWWLDAGIFSSHLGFESAVSMDNATLTRSLVAESSPYFLSGAKLNFTPSDTWSFTALLCNGWQQIKKTAGSTLPALGTQVVYTPREGMTLNWSTFLGSDPLAASRTRFFNNVYALVALSPKLNLIAGLDVGIQETATWYAPVFIVRYAFSERYAGAVRFEHFNDASNIAVSTFNNLAFETTGTSANFDYTPTKNVALRAELRIFQSPEAIFTGAHTQNAFITTSMAMKF